MRRALQHVGPPTQRSGQPTMTELSRTGVALAACHADPAFCVLGRSSAQLAEAGAAPRAALEGSRGAARRGRSEATTSVIVIGHRCRGQALGARYGARSKKSVRGGAVLEVTGGQLDGAQRRPGGRPPLGRRAGAADDGGHDRVDRRRRRCGAASRACAASPAAASASRSSTRASRSTRRSQARRRGIRLHRTKPDAAVDRFGHGTHVAGIIAGSDGGVCRHRARRAHRQPAGARRRTARATRAT